MHQASENSQVRGGFRDRTDTQFHQLQSRVAKRSSVIMVQTDKLQDIGSSDANLRDSPAGRSNVTGRDLPNNCSGRLPLNHRPNFFAFDGFDQKQRFGATESETFLGRDRSVLEGTDKPSCCVTPTMTGLTNQHRNFAAGV